MKPQPSLEASPAAPASPSHKPAKRVDRKRERLFYSGMAAVIAVTVVVGFGRTYYLRPLFTTAALPPLLHLHGAVFTAWLALFVTQTFLVAANRTRVHRRLGVAGAGLAAVVVVLGVVTAIVRAKAGAAPDGVDPLAFMTIPLGDMTVFAILVGTGIAYRRRPDVHKRLMMLAMIALLAAAVARLPFLPGSGPIAFFGATDLFVVACAVYDFSALGRVHRATLLGGLLIVVSQPLRLILAGTPVWIAFARWLTGLVG